MIQPGILYSDVQTASPSIWLILPPSSRRCSGSAYYLISYSIPDEDSLFLPLLRLSRSFDAYKISHSVPFIFQPHAYRRSFALSEVYEGDADEDSGVSIIDSLPIGNGVNTVDEGAVMDNTVGSLTFVKRCRPKVHLTSGAREKSCRYNPGGIYEASALFLPGGRGRLRKTCSVDHHIPKRTITLSCSHTFFFKPSIMTDNADRCRSKTYRLIDRAPDLLAVNNTSLAIRCPNALAKTTDRADLQARSHKTTTNCLFNCPDTDELAMAMEDSFRQDTSDNKRRLT